MLTLPEFWDTISRGIQEKRCYSCQRHQSKRLRTSQNVEASCKVFTSNRKAYGPNAALLQTLIQAAVSQGKYFVRLITLIGPCHLVKKKNRRNAPDKDTGVSASGVLLLQLCSVLAGWRALTWSTCIHHSLILHWHTAAAGSNSLAQAT